jgi:hypothetical protein
LQQANVAIPRIHDLVPLVSLIVSHYDLRGLKRGLEFLTQFAVETRYPGESASKRQATAAMRWAGKVRDACRAALGL